MAYRELRSKQREAVQDLAESQGWMLVKEYVEHRFGEATKTGMSTQDPDVWRRSQGYVKALQDILEWVKNTAMGGGSRGVEKPKEMTENEDG